MNKYFATPLLIVLSSMTLTLVASSCAPSNEPSKKDRQEGGENCKGYISFSISSGAPYTEEKVLRTAEDDYNPLGKGIFGKITYHTIDLLLYRINATEVAEVEHFSFRGSDFREEIHDGKSSLVLRKPAKVKTMTGDHISAIVIINGAEVAKKLRTKEDFEKVLHRKDATWPINDPHLVRVKPFYHLKNNVPTEDLPVPMSGYAEGIQIVPDKTASEVSTLGFNTIKVAVRPVPARAMLTVEPGSSNIPAGGGGALFGQAMVLFAEVINGENESYLLPKYHKDAANHITELRSRHYDVVDHSESYNFSRKGIASLSAAQAYISLYKARYTASNGRVINLNGSASSYLWNYTNGIEPLSIALKGKNKPERLSALSNLTQANQLKASLFFGENTHRSDRSDLTLEGYKGEYRRRNTAAILYTVFIKPDPAICNGGQTLIDAMTSHTTTEENSLEGVENSKPPYIVWGDNGKLYRNIYDAVHPTKGGVAGQGYKLYRIAAHIWGEYYGKPPAAEAFKYIVAYYYAYPNPDHIKETLEAPTWRNNLYHVHVTGFTGIGSNCDPLNYYGQVAPPSGQKAYDPILDVLKKVNPTEFHALPPAVFASEDKLHGQTNLISTEVLVAPWVVSTQEWDYDF